MARTPSASDVAKLSRTEWESLCKHLTISIYGAQPVEDAHGKGNGLDAWARRPPAVEGWQFRRFDARFEDAQARKVRKAIKLAHERSLSEMGAALKRFTLIANVDLEPGHKGKTGEIERWSRTEQFAQTLGIEAEFLGCTWVHTQLLKHPYWRPDLFEDPVDAIEKSKAALLAGQDQILEAIQDAARMAPNLSAALETLIREARVHYERGVQHESSEEMASATRSLEDALRLLDATADCERALRGGVQLALSRVELLRGRLLAAEKYARAALATLEADRSRAYYFSVGSLALCLNAQQRYTECEPLLLTVLEYFEGLGERMEIVRTLTHLVELETNRGNLSSAEGWVERLAPISSAAESELGASDVSVAALGAMANVLMQIGQQFDHTGALERAESALAHICSLVSLDTRIGVTALSNRARVAWFQDRRVEALELFSDVIERAGSTFGKVAADAAFNRALLLAEMGEVADALDSLALAATQYEGLGDVQSHAQAREWIDRLAKGALVKRALGTNAASSAKQPKVGRNEKCPCGSGNKYKKCCGRG